MAGCSAIHMEHQTVLCVQKVEFLQLFFHSSSDPVGLRLLIFQVLRSQSIRHITIGTAPLDVWSALRRNLYLTTHSTHKRQTYMSPGGVRTSNPSKRASADPRQC